MALVMDIIPPDFIVSPDNIARTPPEARAKLSQVLSEGRSKYRFYRNGAVIEVWKEIVVGREGDLVSVSPLIAKHHLVIYRTLAGWKLRALQAKYPTQIKRDGHLMTVDKQETDLQKGDTVILSQGFSFFVCSV